MRDSQPGAGRGLRISTAILVFAAAARLAYLHAYRSDPYSSYLLHDARLYHDWAAALASGKGEPTGAFYQAPLYPHLLAAVYAVLGPNPGAMYLLQTFLGVLTILLISRAALRAYGPLAGLIALGVASLYGATVFYEAKLLPASVAVFLSALLVERMQAADSSPRDADGLATGLILGAAALTSPGLLLMIPLAGAWIGLDRGRPLRRRVLRVAWLLAGAGLLVAPVTLRNYRACGEWVLVSANGGITFYQGNNPNALGVYSTPPGLSASIFRQREESRRLAESETGRKLGDGEVSAFWFRKGLRYLGSDLPRGASLLAKKLLLAAANEEQPLEYDVKLDENPYRWLFPLPFGVIVALAAVRFHGKVPLQGGARAEHPLLFLLLVQGVVLVAFYVSGRYRLPATPALAAMAGCGAAVLGDRLSRGSRSWGTPAVTAAAVALFSFAYVPLVHETLRDEQTAMGLLDRSAALRNAGRLEEAIETMRRSIALDPVFPERHLALARALGEAGRTEPAEQSLREALRLDPRFAEAWFELGVLCVERGRPEEAADAFEEALRLNPSSENAANNLLGVCLHLGRTARATEVWRAMKIRGLAVDPSLDQKVRAPGSEDP